MSEQGLSVKTPPNSKESEMMVLGCMLTSINALNIAAGTLNDVDFYFNEHKLVFQALKEAYKNDAPADVHLIAEALKRGDKLKAVGGIAYLATLAQYAGTSAHIEEYVALVRNKALLRRMIQTAHTIEKKAFDEPDDVALALDGAQQAFFQISQASGASAGYLLKELLEGTRGTAGQPFLKQLEERQEQYRLRGPNDPGVTGVPTHFIDVDKMLNGMGRSNLIILAARPAMGKTAFAINVAENVCFKGNMPVGMFSLEMSAEQLVLRMICSQSGVEGQKIQTGALTSAEFQDIVECVNRIKHQTMIIDDQPGLNISDLRARARRMKEAYGIELLIIDYLQLITGSGSGRSQENRQNEVSEISRMLKTLARELNIPVMCLSQLSRKVEERQGHRPMMSDLRESGAIEQDADVVAFLLRREYYDEHDKPGMAELIIGKNRHGAIGTVPLTFRKEIAQFANFSGRFVEEGS